jgi:hypothetical protein
MRSIAQLASNTMYATRWFDGSSRGLPASHHNHHRHMIERLTFRTRHILFESASSYELQLSQFSPGLQFAQFQLSSPTRRP